MVRLWSVSWALLWLLGPALASAQCTFTITPASISAPATPDTVGQFQVQASASNCARTAASDSSWLTISFGQNGTGNGSIGYRVAANVTAQTRTGGITVGNVRFSVTQAPADCSFALTPALANVPSTGGTGSFSVDTRCQWTAVSSQPWLKVSPPAGATGDGTVNYTVDPNTATAQRTGNIAVGTRVFAVTQAGAPCHAMLTPAEASFTAAGGNGSIAVRAACAWSSAASQNWITVTPPGSGNGDGAISYQVAPNSTALARLGAINVSGQIFTIRQEAAVAVNPEIAAIVNAGSFARDSASPGAIITLFGSRLGPVELATLELTPDGMFLSKSLAGTRVLVDDVPSPMVYTSAAQASAIIPYAIAGKARVSVVVEYNGRRSAPYSLPIAPTAPGLFTLAASGRGAGAILNQDFSVNSPENPAARGSVIMIYATGEGATNPPSVDGKLTAADLPQAIALVQVFMGGALAEVHYKGGAPGLTAGLIQINATVPLATNPGSAVPLDVRMGGVPAQTGVTVAVR